MAKIYNLITDGNSITSGTGLSTPLLTAWPPVTRTNLIASQASHTNAYWSVKTIAVSGHSTPQRTAAFATDVNPHFSLAYARNIVTFFEVSNDIINNAATLPLAISNVQAYVRQARGYGWDVLLMTVPPTTRTTNSANTLVLQFNDWLRANPEWSDLPIVDIAAHPDLDDPSNVTYYSDGLHMEAAGYAIVAGLMEDALSALGDAPPALNLLLKRIVYDFDLLEASNPSLWETAVADIATAKYRQLFQAETMDRDRFRYYIYGLDRQQQTVIYAELVAAYPYA